MKITLESEYGVFYNGMTMMMTGILIREVVAAVTSKGQTTIPLEVRKRLGLGPQDKVAFVLTDDNRVEVRQSEPRSVVEETTGIFKRTAPVQTAEQIRELAEQVIADAAIERVKAA